MRPLLRMHIERCDGADLRRHVIALLLVLMTHALSDSRLLAQEVGETVVRSGTLFDDLYVAGGRVHVLADARGDVVAAGGRVLVGEQVAGDVIAAGGAVEVRGRVGDDVRMAGGQLVLDGQVAGDAIAAGGRVRMTPDAVVGGRAWLAGGDVEIGGHVGRELKVGAGHVTLNARVDGDVELRAGRISILPGARIAGDLVYQSAEPADIAPGAQIAGRVQRLEGEPPAPRMHLGFGGALIVLASLLVTGGVLLWLLPRFSRRATRSIGDEPWKTLGLGLALLVATPVASALLMVTVVGIPLGLSALALYAVALLAAFLIAVSALGDAGLRLARREAPATGWRVLGLAIALVIVGLLQLIPFVGGLILLLATLFGLGGWGLELSRAYRAGAAHKT